MNVISIFQLVVLIFSVMIHEISHGFVALKLGDPTAKNLGRLTLNPIKHIDLFGSIILPFLFIISGSQILFGWAKPVPYNPMNVRMDPKKAAAIIGGAGPVSNLLVALVFGILVRILYGFIGNPLVDNMLILANVVVLINVLLAIFNLLPIPPLDGSNILFALLPPGYENVQRFLQRWGFFILLIFVFSPLFTIIHPIIFGLYRIFVGPAAFF